jgi:lipoate-protein ligase A
MLYRNEPSIVVGKHQNAFAEINYWFVKEKGIKVVRRLSGGGTVFHDLGNTNFTFIQNGSEGNLVDFKRFTEPILQSLTDMGLPATRSNRNDLLVNGLKVSGNAEHIYKKRVLHHGTLLYSTSLDDLRDGLKVKGEYSDRAVKSVRSSVTNISEYLKEAPLISLFNKKIENAILESFKNVKYYQFSAKDIKEINHLVEEKYGTWEWNYAYSPRFTVLKRGKIKENALDVQLEVEKGTITKAEITGDIDSKDAIEEALLLARYNEEELKSRLSSIPANKANLDFWLKLIL